MRFATIAALSALSIVAAAALAAPVPELDVQRLVAASDTVVVGKMSQATPAGELSLEMPNGQVQARRFLATITVDQVLKGTIDLGKTLAVEFALPKEPLGYVKPRDSQCVYFLKHRAGHFEFASPYHPSVVGTTVQTALAGTEIERVAQAVSGILRSPAASVSERIEAVRALKTSKIEPANQALREALRDEDQGVRLSATAALLSLDDLTGMLLAEDALSRSSGGASSTDLQRLRLAITDGLSNESAIPSLLRIMSAENPETRQAVVSALGHIGSPRAIKGLAGALGDADTEVRYLAVKGLAYATGEVSRAPAREAYKADESRYLSYWRRGLANVGS